jgi:cephalosporin-C deacetylase-like acetyl esterase
MCGKPTNTEFDSRQKQMIFTLVDLQLDAQNSYLFTYNTFGFGGLEVACWLLVPKFAGLNPAEVVGFLRAKKSSALLPSERK